MVFNPGAVRLSFARGTAGVAIPLLKHADERGKLGIAHFACGIFDIKPGSPPLALFRPALTVFADLEKKDPHLDESPIAELPLDITIAADSLAEDFAFNAGLLRRLPGRGLAILNPLGRPTFGVIRRPVSRDVTSKILVAPSLAWRSGKAATCLRAAIIPSLLFFSHSVVYPHI